MDKYLSDYNCYIRLREEYTKYRSLIIAYDFDNTVYDYHNKGETYDKVIELLRECKSQGFFLIVYTCNGEEKYEIIRNYLIENDIPFDSINENSPDIKFAHKKLYYNLLLDDRAGLPSAYHILNKLIKEIKGEI